MLTLLCDNLYSHDARGDLFVNNQLNGYAWTGERVRVLEPKTGQYVYGKVTAISFSGDRPVWHVKVDSQIYGGWIDYEPNTQD